MKSFLCILALFVSSACVKTHRTTLFKSSDHTAENLFSENIEGPSFDEDGNLYVVNFQRDGSIGLVKPDGDVSLFLTLSDSSIANSIQFDSKGDMFLADFVRHNILKVDLPERKISVHVHSDDFNQPNDLCINAKDQIFASDPNWRDNTGQLWRADPDGSLTLLARDMGTTNGIELNPEETILYVNESVQRKIWAFDVDSSGNISNKKMFAEFDDFGFDGMKCDAEGNLYVTRYGKGTIAVLSPKGELVREISLKGKRCSNLVFGGKDNKTVFVTLQDRKGIEKFENDLPGKKRR